jgi:hypothetical protein
MARERVGRDVGAETDDRADAEIDVPRQHHHRLADGDDADHGHVRRDVLPVADGEEVVGSDAEDEDGRRERDEDPELAQPEGRGGQRLR